MAACVQTPSLTRTDVSTSESLFPTSSVLTSTLPGSVSTSIFRTCTRTNTSIPCEPTLTSILVNIPGNTTVLTVPVTGTIDVPITNIVTLFGSSCSSSISTPPPDSPTSSSTTSSTPVFSTSTPPPSIVTSSSVFTTDGSTFVSVFQSTTTPPPTVVDTSSTGTSLQFTDSSSSFTPPTSSSSSSTVPTLSYTSYSASPSTSAAVVVVQSTGTSLPNNGVHQNDKKANNTGPIVGGVVGGLVALVVLGLLTWKLIKKQSRFDDVFNQDHKHHNKPKKDSDPKPYDYGLIGQSTNPTGLDTHGLDNNAGNDVGHQGGQQAGNNVGYQGGNDTGYQGGQGGNDVGYQGGNNIGSGGNTTGSVPNQPPLQHLRNPSLAPLLAGVGAAAAAATANASASSRPSSSRPSSSSSQPSGPLVTNAPQGQYPPIPSSSYPPALQNWSNTQGYAPMNAPGGYQNPATTNSQGYGAGPSMAGPSSGLTHTGSVTSFGSDPSTYSTSSWAGPSGSGGGSGPVFNPALPGMVPLIAATGMRNNNKQKAPALPQQYEDPFARSGSPVSIQEQRILQVTNGEPSSPGANESGIYNPNAYYSAEASSSSSTAAGPSTSGGSQAGSSSTGGVIDGKGRPLNFRGEKAPLVHLDGGVFEERAPDAPIVGPAPPAYSEAPRAL
ncbi:hypothetical protein GALMADRAFT_142159 [Galerina marginata CBS 339.88]|uniref:Mid2 domain-containing protein n=1 Tax=Galerina marginata (strain CBS 339.88) TaxID=685588 RepID=A0A067T3U5_GALM3|nr:hypothetical protein GALMADRAFT_142159 [Galerina marginata CBS 339.88]